MTTEDQEIVNEVFVLVGKAIAAYERKLIRGDAPFDAWVAEAEAGDPESDLISKEAKAGLSLFLGEGNCILCHSGPLFSNKAFHNIGLADRNWLTPFDNGRFNGISSLLDNPFNGSGRFSDDAEAGSLKIDHLVQGIEQLGAYKTPSLRNLPDTAPYMHGGHFATLTEVVESYSELEEMPSVGHREQFMETLNWDDNEIASMVAFLESLQGAPLDATLNGSPDSPIPPGDSD
jgi:cytochrome c peroxidase